MLGAHFLTTENYAVISDLFLQAAFAKTAAVVLDRG
jgi:hypothetical protein